MIVTILTLISIIPVWELITGTPPLTWIRNKTKPRSHKKDYQKINDIITTYKRKKHLAQNQFLVINFLLIEFFRIILTLPFVFTGIFFTAKNIILELRKFGITTEPFDENYISAVLLVLPGILLFHYVIKENVAPLYHFRDFNRLTLLHILNNLEKAHFALPKEMVEDIKNIKNESFLDTSDSSANLPLFTPHYDYTSYVNKKIKNSVVDERNLKMRLDRALEKM